MFEPSALIQSLLDAAASRQSTSPGIQETMRRQEEFPDPMAAQITGLALDEAGRSVADQILDSYWSNLTVRQNALNPGSTAGRGREVIIGSGFHAAVYAAVRVLNGYPKPLVLERDTRVGGTFAMTDRPVFYLNSRNRAGRGGLAGDLQASLNYLPGAPIQAANLSMAEYQRNTDMAFVIRVTLAQFADVATDAQVVYVTPDTLTSSGTTSGTGTGAEIQIQDGRTLSAGRVIDARGLGDPHGQGAADGTTIVTFTQFMRRMANPFPLRRIRRVAVVGGGDSAKCAVEALLGVGPPPYIASAALDQVDLIDWYAEGLPTTCEQWVQDIRGRYQAIGRYLVPDRLGRRRLQVLARRARPVALPGSGLIDGRSYDLVVLCIGNRESAIDGLESDSFDEYPTPTTADPDPFARKHFNMSAFRVGPHAQLPFTDRERHDGVADIDANAVSMFRTASKTATLAATLPPLPPPVTLA